MPSDTYTLTISDLGVAAVADNAVTTAKILDANVTTAKIADLNVTTAKLATDSVITAKIVDLNVTTDKIAAGAVTDVKLATNAVTTIKITDLNVTTDKLAAAAVTNDKLAVITGTGKIANSATTATDANTASAIVARDGSGNFSAGVITAALTGNATTATTATNLAVGTAGALPYQTAAGATAFISAAATGNVLLSGGAATVPQYGPVPLATHVSGILPVIKGGTGAASLTGYVKASGTAVMTASASVPVADISGTLPVDKGGTGVTQSAYGEYYISTAAATTISTAGDYVKVAGTTTAGSFLSNFTHTSGNRLMYTGTAALRKFFVNASISFHGFTGHDYAFAIRKNNSTTVASSIVEQTGEGANDVSNISVQCIIELSNTDFIEVFVTNMTSTNAPTVDHMNVLAIALI